MNKKQEDQIQFSRGKKIPEKEKMDSPLVNPPQWLMDFDDQLIDSTRIFFHLHQNICHAIEKKTELK